MSDYLRVRITQECIADMINKSHSSYNRLENGKTKLGLNHLSKIAKAMNMTEEEILKAVSGNTITTTNSDNAQNNQNLVINFSIDQKIIKLLEENNKVIEFLSQKLDGINITLNK